MKRFERLSLFARGFLFATGPFSFLWLSATFLLPVLNGASFLAALAIFGYGVYLGRAFVRNPDLAVIHVQKVYRKDGELRWGDPHEAT